MTPDREDIVSFIAEARLAPSVHNTQPTRWRIMADGSVLVLEDGSRRLPAGDPAGRDAGVSHGAAVEGFALAAGARGWTLAVAPADEGAAEATTLRPVARLSMARGGAADPLHPFVEQRRTYRGAFVANAVPADFASIEAVGDARVVAGREEVAELARLNDVGSLRTFRDGPFRGELLSWMRLSKRHPLWGLDGLNREAMAMSPLEAVGAGVVLRPGVFEALDRLGLAAPLTAEAGVVNSANAIVLFHRPEDEAPLQTGRRFYRLWLEFTRLGLSAAPMAVLADDPDLRTQIASRFEVPAGRRLITAFRVGRPASPPVAVGPRLPLSELIV